MLLALTSLGRLGLGRELTDQTGHQGLELPSAAAASASASACASASASAASAAAAAACASAAHH